MELTQGEQVEAERLIGIERRQVRRRVNFIQLVVDVATAELVVGRNVEVNALDKVLEVFESRRRDRNRAASKPVVAAVKPSHAPFAGSPSCTECNTASRSYRHILLEDAEVGCAETGIRRNRGQATRRGREHLGAAGSGKSYRLALEVSEEEQLVLDDRPAESGAVAVAVEARVRGQALQRRRNCPPRSYYDF